MEPLGAPWAPKFSFRKWVCAAVSFVYICAHVYAYVCTQTFFLVRMRTCTQNSLHTRIYATELTRKKKLTAPWPECKKVWYCGEYCQKKYASRHKNYCKLWADGVTEGTWVVVYSTASGSACYLCTQDPQLNGTNEKYRFLPLSFCRVSCCWSRFATKVTRVAILSKFFNALSARYLSTLLGSKSESFRPRLEHAKPTEASKARPNFDPLN